MTFTEPDCNIIRQLAESLRSDQNVNDNLSRYEQAMEEEVNWLCMQGISGGAGHIHKISSYHTQGIEYTVEVKARHWLNEYEAIAADLNHRQRRRKLEDIIRQLSHLEITGIDKILILLAKAYLWRGTLFRPKGVTVPARKIEAFLEAFWIAKRVLDNDDNNLDALRVGATAVIELEKVSDHLTDDFYLVFINAVEGINHEILTLNDLFVIIRFEEIYSDTDYLEIIFSEQRDWERSFDLALIKARAAFLLNDPQEAEQYVSHALDNAPVSFADPFWNDLITFLSAVHSKSTKDKDWEIWKELALKAHDICKTGEANISSNVYIRWHWGRHKDFYDLAFVAEGNPEKKACIADSLKAKSVLRYAAIDKIKKDDRLKQYLEIENEDRDGRYLKRRPELYSQAEAVVQKSLAEPQWNLLPEPYIGIHFYLYNSGTIHGEKLGRAIINDSMNGSWEITDDFNYSGIYDQFVSWHTAYSQDGLSTGENLRALCQEMGKELAFLFELDKGRPLVFVPHGFFHQLPLHAAIDADDGQILLHHHPTRYLPAWRLYEGPIEKASGQNRYIHHYSSHDFAHILDNDAFRWHIPEEKANIRDVIRTNPEIFLLLCHGEQDMLNPFRFRLKLSSPFTVLDLLTQEADLKGSTIFLGACESEMAPSLDQLIDEHLSLGTAFLTRQAREVVGGLWQVNDHIVEECYHWLLCAALNATNEPFQRPPDLSIALQKWQKLKKSEGMSLEQFAPFRIIGLPQPSNTDEQGIE